MDSIPLLCGHLHILIGPNDYIDTLMTYKKIYNYQNANVWNVHVNTV